MSTTLNEGLFDATVELHLDIMRVDKSVRFQVVKLLEKMRAELTAKLAGGVTDWTQARIARQLSEAEQAIRDYYEQAAGISQDAARQVATVSAGATAQSLSVAVGGLASVGLLPTVETLEAIAGNAIIEGATQAAWWERQAGDTAFKFKAAVRQGLVAAETNAQIVRRVRDAMDVSRRNAETLVRTAVQTVANDVRERVFADHGDIIEALERVATLDRRTCPSCGALDGKRWTLAEHKPIGHTLRYVKAPIHYQCRCTDVPVLKTWRELGINLDEVPDGTRASMDGQTTDKTFEEWLRRRPEGYADDVLGKGRADLWRRKVITLDQMLDGARGLTLAELVAKYGRG